METTRGKEREKAFPDKLTGGCSKHRPSSIRGEGRRCQTQGWLCLLPAGDRGVAAPWGAPGLRMGCPRVDFGVFLGIGTVLLDKTTPSGLRK